MEFKKKMKINMIYYALLVVIGAALAVLQLTGYMPDVFLSFGCAYAACGLAMLIKNGRIMADPEKLKKLEIESTDERNIMIYNKAIRWAYFIFVYAAAAAIMILEFIGMKEAAVTVALTLCALFVLYIICYAVLKAKG